MFCFLGSLDNKPLSCLLSSDEHAAADGFVERNLERRARRRRRVPTVCRVLADSGAYATDAVAPGVTRLYVATARLVVVQVSEARGAHYLRVVHHYRRARRLLQLGHGRLVVGGKSR